MSENDYIAEYVKERRPDILGLDYAFWKMSKIVLNFAENIAETFKQAPLIDNTKEDAKDAEHATDDRL